MDDKTQQTEPNLSSISTTLTAHSEKLEHHAARLDALEGAAESWHDTSTGPRPNMALPVEDGGSLTLDQEIDRLGEHSPAVADLLRKASKYFR